MIDKMKKFTCVQDIGDLKSALAEACLLYTSPSPQDRG